ncbi:MAG TPA: hypothetical protein VG013_00105 [Gemmataceae bacterium]|jgi:hypothetical protein|nr:hypothetical protein [Gemmataceae bacterium]
MTFPEDWPDRCPPDDAEDANGEVFRVAKANPPTADDFKSYYELGVKRGDLVLRCGVSVFRLVLDAEHASRKFRNMGKVIAKAVLRAEHGKTKQTGRPTHTTWWPYVEVDRRSLFAVVGVVA